MTTRLRVHMTDVTKPSLPGTRQLALHPKRTGRKLRLGGSTGAQYTNQTTNRERRIWIPVRVVHAYKKYLVTTPRITCSRRDSDCRQNRANWTRGAGNKVYRNLRVNCGDPSVGSGGGGGFQLTSAIRRCAGEEEREDFHAVALRVTTLCRCICVLPRVGNGTSSL